MRLVLVAALCLSPLSVQAEEMPDLFDYLDSIKTDVTAKGGIGFNSEGNARFLPDGQRSTFPAQFAVDRETLKQINENCVFGSFMFTADDLCSATISAEITFDGPQVNLLIFAVDNLETPKKAKP